ncbi:carboxy terminal-processing peptidase [Pedobacter gandavensis]|uniref:carboxy terminal-processing peptidase n=1 Tax=Pedobacter gandavensis TaxID=2679963 RepID=UPI0029310974|nr:carboxy terminal-processing peptidase [Pedobacter gandavensis]
MNLNQLYKRRFLLAISGVCLSFSVHGQAIELVAERLHFQPLSNYPAVTKTIAATIANYHYQKVTIDDALSTRIFDQYLTKLDKSHALFLASDLQEFEQYRYLLDDALLSGDLSAAFEMFNVYAARLDHRIDAALTELSKVQPLHSKEVYQFSREQLPWFKSSGEADAYWNQRIRYELIRLRADGRENQKAYELLGKRYEKLKTSLEGLKSENVLELFLNAFTETIDPHTTYFSPAKAQDFNVMMNKSLEGIGITFSFQDELPVIMSVIKGGPADKTKKIMPNDRILAIAQGESAEFEEVTGWTQEEVLRNMRGLKGSLLRVKILPAGADLSSSPLVVSIIRDKVVMEDQKVKSELKLVKQGGKTQKIGVISIPDFYFDVTAFSKGEKDYASTSGDVKKALELLKSQGIDGLMIDLRNNGGGSLKEAIDLSGLFIKYGPVVQVRDSKNKVLVHSDQDSLVAYSGPLTILTNRLSASASEIFTAAMQDYGRAVIIGGQTFGKGTVQGVYGLDQLMKSEEKNLGSLKLTNAKFYRINGASTQHRGVSPDISFPSKYSALKVGESTLKNVLPYDEIAASNFIPLAQLKMINQQLEKHHQQRMQTNQEFSFLKEDIQKSQYAAANSSIQLDLKAFLEARKNQQIQDLKRINQRRKSLGLKTVTANDPVNGMEVDYVKEESLQITAELIRII